MEADLVALDKGFLNLVEMYASCSGGELHVEPDCVWAHTPVDFPVFQGVFQTEMQVATADERIQEIASYFRERGRSAIWFPGTRRVPPDLTDRLARAGFPAVVELTGLVLDYDKLAASPKPPHGVEIRFADDEDSVRAYAAIYPLLFGEEDTSFIPSIVDAEVEAFRKGHGCINRYVAKLDGVPVAACATSQRNGYSQLDTLCTLPQLRNRGIGAALAAKALLGERDKGAARAIVWAGPGAEKLYRRMGFEQLCTTPVYAIV